MSAETDFIRILMDGSLEKAMKEAQADLEEMVNSWRRVAEGFPRMIEIATMSLEEQRLLAARSRRALIAELRKKEARARVLSWEGIWLWK